MHVQNSEKHRTPGGEPYMLEGISPAENDYLQRRANAVAQRVFRRRIKDPAKTASDLRAALGGGLNPYPHDVAHLLQLMV